MGICGLLQFYHFFLELLRHFHVWSHDVIGADSCRAYLIFVSSVNVGTVALHGADCVIFFAAKIFVWYLLYWVSGDLVRILVEQVSMPIQVVVDDWLRLVARLDAESVVVSFWGAKVKSCDCISVVDVLAVFRDTFAEDVAAGSVRALFLTTLFEN